MHEFKFRITRSESTELLRKHSMWIVSEAIRTEYNMPDLQITIDNVRTSFDIKVYTISVPSVEDELVFFLKTGLEKYYDISFGRVSSE